MMKFFSYLLPLLLLISGGCTSSVSSGQSKYETSVALKEVRVEIADLRHCLNNAQIEIQILEEQVHEQEKLIKQVKTAPSATSRVHLPEIEQRLSHLEQIQKKVQDDLRIISSHSNQTSGCLKDYSAKISQIEQTLQKQGTIARDINELKASLKAFTTSLSEEASTKSTSLYRVKSGDSLERIARFHKISIEDLKKANHLSNDKIIIGQELKVPSSQ